MLAGQAAPSEPTPDISADFTARELYVSCSLVLSGDRLASDKIGKEFKSLAPATCAVSTLRAFVTTRKEQKSSVLRFCPNGIADFDAAPLNAMALAYVQYYEENAPAMNKLSGFAALFYALKNKWPCDL